MQYANKKDKSAATALDKLHEEQMKAIYKNEVNLLMGINMSTAFDIVNMEHQGRFQEFELDLG